MAPEWGGLSVTILSKFEPTDRFLSLKALPLEGEGWVGVYCPIERWNPLPQPLPTGEGSHEEPTRWRKNA